VTELETEILVDEWVSCYAGGWKGVIVGAAFSHPAKAAFNLTKRIYEHAISEGWIKPGDCVVDPFGGIGGCAFHGLMNGMRVVTCELEAKFCLLAHQNVALWLERYGCTCGEATKLYLRSVQDSVLQTTGTDQAVAPPLLLTSVSRLRQEGSDPVEQGSPVVAQDEAQTLKGGKERKPREGTKRELEGRPDNQLNGIRRNQNQRTAKGRASSRNGDSSCPTPEANGIGSSQEREQNGQPLGELGNTNHVSTHEGTPPTGRDLPTQDEKMRRLSDAIRDDAASNLLRTLQERASAAISETLARQEGACVRCCRAVLVPPRVLQGDSRKLASVVREARIAVSSPPFLGVDGSKRFKSEEERQRFLEGQRESHPGRSDDALSKMMDNWTDMGESEGQLGAMKEGDLSESLALTSPNHERIIVSHELKNSDGCGTNPAIQFWFVGDCDSREISSNPKRRLVETEEGRLRPASSVGSPEKGLRDREEDGNLGVRPGSLSLERRERSARVQGKDQKGKVREMRDSPEPLHSPQRLRSLQQRSEEPPSPLCELSPESSQDALLASEARGEANTEIDSTEPLAQICVSSPPFGAAQSGGGFANPESELWNQLEKQHRRQFNGVSRRCWSNETQGQTDGQLAGMKDDGFAAAISSPPYNPPMSQDHNGSRGGKRGTEPSETGAFVKYGTSEGQIEGLSMDGFDVAISSPPYVSGGHHPDQTGAWGGQAQANTKDQAGYGREDGQMGQMKDEGFDCAVSSPPYEGSMNAGAGGIDWEKAGRPDRLIPSANRHGVEGSEQEKRYGEAEGQVGAMVQDTFWSASRTILEQLYSVLTPGAHAIFIVKAFVRNKAIVDFPGQWAQLCEAVGFKLIHDHHALLTEHSGTQAGMFGEDKEYKTKRVSFFRRLHERRAPETEIFYENVLCFIRP
jgi:hypothetical protein